MKSILIKDTTREEREAIVAEALGKLGLSDGLLGRAAGPRHHHDHLARALLKAHSLLLGNAQDPLQKIMLGLADLKLRGMHADRKAADPRIQIVSDDRALMPLVKAPVLIEGKGIGGDHGARVELF